MRRLAPLPFFAGATALLWNAWWRPSALDVAYLFLAGSVVVTLLSLGLIAAAKRPADRYWAFATLGLVLGFWLQR